MTAMDSKPLLFRILGEPVCVEMPTPPARMRLDEMLPTLYALQDGFSEVGTRRHGRPVSCARGCAACCRIQPVPVTPIEAYALLLLVEGLPEPRKSAVVSRFAECAARLNEAGLAEGFLTGRRPSSQEQAKAEAMQYFDLKLACPFLEDDACSIYPARPFTCREYFVTTPPDLCTDPIGNPVRTVPGIVQAVQANGATAAAFLGSVGFAVPLTLALLYAGKHRAVLEREYDSNRVISHSVADLYAVAGTQGLLG